MSLARWKSIQINAGEGFILLPTKMAIRQKYFSPAVQEIEPDSVAYHSAEINASYAGPAFVLLRLGKQISLQVSG